MPRRCSASTAVRYSATLFWRLCASRSELGAEALDPEEDADAAGVPHQVEQFRVPGDVEAGLRQPPLLERDHRPQQLLDVGALRRQVVVPEPDDLALPPVREVVGLDVAHDLGDGPDAEAGVDGRDRAERATEGAAARRLDDAANDEAGREQVVARGGQAGQRLRPADIAWPQRSLLDVGQQPGPDRLGLADDDRVAAVGERLVRPEGGVRAAGDDDLAAPLELAGQPIRLGGEAAEEGEGDQVGVGGQVDRLDLLMEDADAVRRRGQGGQVEAGDRRDEVDLVAPGIAGQRDDDDVDAHGPPLVVAAPAAVAPVDVSLHRPPRESHDPNTPIAAPECLTGRVNAGRMAGGLKPRLGTHPPCVRAPRRSL